MPPPSRSRSLRQPGYAHRELIGDGQAMRITTRHDLKPNRPGGTLEAQGHGCADDLLLGTKDGGQTLSQNAKPVFDKSHKRRPGAPSTLGTEISEQHPRDACQISGKVWQNKNISPDSTEGDRPCSSGLPFVSQRSRLPSLQRWPSSAVSRSKAAKIVHSSNASIARHPSTSSRLSSLSKIPQTQPGDGAPEYSRSMSPPAPVSITSNPVAARQRSGSNGQAEEHGYMKTTPKAGYRLMSVAKPQFSAYQRRFSPRQKPPVSAAKMRGSVPDEAASDNHFGALQDELLQLQLMYLSADQTLQSWAESGERRTDEQEKKHSQEVDSVYKIEHFQQVCINGATFRGWLTMDLGKSSVEKVESLAYCVQTMTDLARPQQKLCRVVEQFESWSEQVTDALIESPSGFPEDNLGLIPPLGRAWNEAKVTLTRSFEAILRSLQELGTGDEPSGLGLVLRVHTRFAKNALDELNIMGAIHSMALDRRDAWIKIRLSDLVEKTSASELLAGSLARQPAWDQVP